MKVRIGISPGPAGVPGQFDAAVARLEQAGVDSLWLSEMVYGPLADPVAGMTWALARTERLKVGTGIMVLPGRHPVLVAKQLATLAGLAPGRVLPVFGLKPARPGELAAFGVPPGRRGDVFDEALELLRLLLSSAPQPVDFAGRFFAVRAASVGPAPAKPLDIWLGGSAAGALRRVGRLGDGWLGSFLTPAEAAVARRLITEAADTAGREVDPEHFGISLAVGPDGIPAGLAAAAAERRPGLDPARLAAGSWAAARTLIGEYVDAGLSKFVVRPAGPGDFGEFLAAFAAEMMPLQT